MVNYVALKNGDDYYNDADDFAKSCGLIVCAYVPIFIAMAIIVHASVSGVVDYEMFSFIEKDDPSRFTLLSAELITTAVYLLLGIVCLILGRRSLDWITPYDLNKEIQEERNVGVGAIEASIYISIAVIIHGIIV